MPDKETQMRPSTARRVYTPKEVQEILGISHAHFYALLSEAKIKTIKIGGSRRVPVEEIDRILVEGA